MIREAEGLDSNRKSRTLAARKSVFHTREGMQLCVNVTPCQNSKPQDGTKYVDCAYVS